MAVSISSLAVAFWSLFDTSVPVPLKVTPTLEVRTAGPPSSEELEPSSEDPSAFFLVRLAPSDLPADMPAGRRPRFTLTTTLPSSSSSSPLPSDELLSEEESES